MVDEQRIYFCFDESENFLSLVKGDVVFFENSLGTSVRFLSLPHKEALRAIPLDGCFLVLVQKKVTEEDVVSLVNAVQQGAVLWIMHCSVLLCYLQHFFSYLFFRVFLVSPLEIFGFSSVLVSSLRFLSSFRVVGTYGLKSDDSLSLYANGQGSLPLEEDAEGVDVLKAVTLACGLNIPSSFSVYQETCHGLTLADCETLQSMGYGVRYIFDLRLKEGHIFQGIYPVAVPKNSWIIVGSCILVDQEVGGKALIKVAQEENINLALCASFLQFHGEKKHPILWRQDHFSWMGLEHRVGSYYVRLVVFPHTEIDEVAFFLPGESTYIYSSSFGENVVVFLLRGCSEKELATVLQLGVECSLFSSGFVLRVEEL